MDEIEKEREDLSKSLLRALLWGIVTLAGQYYVSSRDRDWECIIEAAIDVALSIRRLGRAVVEMRSARAGEPKE